MTRLVPLLALLLISTTCIAGSLTPATLERVQTLTLDGLHNAYNFEFKTADQRFNEAIRIEPLHPRPYVGKATIIAWRYLLSRNDTDKEAFLSSADLAIEVAEEYEDTFGETADAQICLGTIYAYRSFVHGRSKSYLKGAWDGKRSFDYFSNALNLDAHAYDAYLGLGLFHYFTTFIPKPLQWIVAIMGIRGDSELGMKELRIAASKGTYGKVESQYYLAQFLPWHDGDFDSGEKIIADLHRQYPSNTLIAFTRAAWEIRRNDVATAKERLISVVDTTDDLLDGVKSYAVYKLAECYFRLGDYSRARVRYREFLRNYHDEIYVATANYRLGVCYELEGNRDSALSRYRKAAKAARIFGDDAYAARRAEQRMASRLAPSDTMALAAQNALRSGNYDRAILLYAKVQALVAPTDELQAEADFGIGEALYEKGAYNESLARLERASKATLVRERWLHPWSHYQRGLAALKIADPHLAKLEFEHALEYEEFDFKNWLEFRAKREIEKLERVH